MLHIINSLEGKNIGRAKLEGLFCVGSTAMKIKELGNKWRLLAAEQGPGWHIRQFCKWNKLVSTFL